MIDLNYLCLFEHVLLQCNVLPCYCSVMFFNQLLQIYKYIVQHWPIRKPIWCITRLIKQLSTPANTEESQKRCQWTRSVAMRQSSSIYNWCTKIHTIILCGFAPCQLYTTNPSTWCPMRHPVIRGRRSRLILTTWPNRLRRLFWITCIRPQGLPKRSFSNLLVGNSVFPTDAEDLP